MKLTLAEASRTWCPHVRLSLGGNRLPPSGVATQQTLCIGDKCSAWRWHGRFVEEAFKDPRFTPRGTSLSVAHDEAVGFCGLAGDPF